MLLMGKLRRVGFFLVSKTVAAGILGFLLSLFSTLILYAIPIGKELDFAKALFIPIMILMLYVLGLYNKIMKRCWEYRRFRIPIVIGVLKGYLDDSKKGIECKGAYTQKNWLDYFNGTDLKVENSFTAKEIFWSEISSEYAAIINPFGEIYLEEDRRTYKTYEKIKEFIADGGIFCCTGGFPFYYYWDHITGLPLDTTPKTRTIQNGSLQDIRLVFDSLVTRDFGAIIIIHSQSATPEKVFQEKKPDIEFFGELCSIGGTDVVSEFRSLSEESRGRIPGLRFKHGDEVKFPLAAIPYGKGYLIIAGMNVGTDVEFQKLTRGINNFVTEIARRHTENQT
jgi:hypothetical protein